MNEDDWQAWLSENECDFLGELRYGKEYREGIESTLFYQFFVLNRRLRSIFREILNIVRFKR